MKKIFLVLLLVTGVFSFTSPIYPADSLETLNSFMLEYSFDKNAYPKLAIFLQKFGENFCVSGKVSFPNERTFIDRGSRVIIRVFRDKESAENFLTPAREKNFPWPDGVIGIIEYPLYLGELNISKALGLVVESEDHVYVEDLLEKVEIVKQTAKQ